MEDIYKEIISNISLLVGIIFLITAVLMYKFPPKDINHLYGYRTKRSMKSQPAWDFAQQYSTKKMILVSIGLIIFGILDILIIEDYTFTIIVGLSLTILGFIYILITTEKELKKRF